MKKSMVLACASVFIAFFTICGIFHSHYAKADGLMSPVPGLDKNIDAVCGKGPIKTDPSDIPWIGCFYLHNNHSALGFFDNKPGMIIAQGGKAVFTFNGRKADKISGPRYPDGGNSEVKLYSSNPDYSVLLVVSECLPSDSKVCYTTSDDWNRAKGIKN